MASKNSQPSIAVKRTIRRSAKKLGVLGLAPAAVLAGVQLGGPVVASGHTAPTIAADRGNPDAQPPILRPASPSELVLVRQSEAQKAAASAYEPPASGEYSFAELNAHANRTE